MNPTPVLADVSNFFENAGLLVTGAVVGAVAATVLVIVWIKRHYTLTKIGQ